MHYIIEFILYFLLPLPPHVKKRHTQRSGFDRSVTYAFFHVRRLVRTNTPPLLFMLIPARKRIIFQKKRFKRFQILSKLCIGLCLCFLQLFQKAKRERSRAVLLPIGLHTRRNTAPRHLGKRKAVLRALRVDIGAYDALICLRAANLVNAPHLLALAVCVDALFF